jgi:hypothetical protein
MIMRGCRPISTVPASASRVPSARVPSLLRRRHSKRTISPCQRALEERHRVLARVGPATPELRCASRALSQLIRPCSRRWRRAFGFGVDDCAAAKVGRWKNARFGALEDRAISCVSERPPLESRRQPERRKSSAIAFDDPPGRSAPRRRTITGERPRIGAGRAASCSVVAAYPFECCGPARIRSSGNRWRHALRREAEGAPGSPSRTVCRRAGYADVSSARRFRRRNRRQRAQMEVRCGSTLDRDQREIDAQDPGEGAADQLRRKRRLAQGGRNRERGRSRRRFR